MAKNNAMDRHNDATRIIYHRPSVIGLDDIVMSCREANMIKEDGNIYHQPDNLCFNMKHRIIYNIEYKTNGGSNKASFQLREQCAVLKQMFPEYKIVNLYVHNDFKIETVK